MVYTRYSYSPTHNLTPNTCFDLNKYSNFPLFMEQYSPSVFYTYASLTATVKNLFQINLVYGVF